MKILILALFALVGCKERTFLETKGGPIGMGNPASIACTESGGESVLVKNDKMNETRLCAFGKAMILEQTLFQHQSIGEIEKAPLAIKVFLSSRENRNDASCKDFDAKLEELEGKNTFEICTFSDESGIELTTLARGATSTTNKKLVTALQTDETDKINVVCEAVKGGPTGGGVSVTGTLNLKNVDVVNSTGEIGPSNLVVTTASGAAKHEIKVEGKMEFIDQVIPTVTLTTTHKEVKELFLNFTPVDPQSYVLMTNGNKSPVDCAKTKL